MQKRGWYLWLLSLLLFTLIDLLLRNGSSLRNLEGCFWFCGDGDVWNQWIYHMHEFNKITVFWEDLSFAFLVVFFPLLWIHLYIFVITNLFVLLFLVEMKHTYKYALYNVHNFLSFSFLVWRHRSFVFEESHNVIDDVRW